MGKVLVLYHSASGHTATMAELVAEGARVIPGIEVRLRSLETATPNDVDWCDGLAVGSPTNMGVLSCDPALAVPRESAAGDHAVQMRVQKQVLELLRHEMKPVCRARRPLQESRRIQILAMLFPVPRHRRDHGIQDESPRVSRRLENDIDPESLRVPPETPLRAAARFRKASASRLHPRVRQQSR